MNPRVLLLLCLLLAGCAAPAPYAATPVVNHPVLRSLAAQRAHFFATGDPGDVFAVFYFHSTTEILRLLRTGAVRHPRVMEEMITEFHADYVRSRSPALCDPAWQPYYQRAARLRTRSLTWPDLSHPRDLFHPRSLSALAGSTHLDHDLPRCIARVLARHPELPLAELEADFHAVDSILLNITTRALHDLAACVPDAPGPRNIAFQSSLAAAVVKMKRHRAWRRGAAAAGNPALRHAHSKPCRTRP